MSYYGQTYEDPEYYDEADESDWQDMEDADEDYLNDQGRAV